MRRIFTSAMSVLLIGAFMICPAFAASSFPDVDENAAYAEAVQCVNEMKIMQGDNKGNFNPDKNVTRAEMAAIICRILYEDASATDGTVFNDVPANHWANGYIVKAAELGIVSGYGNGNFGPSDTVTYEQAIAMFMRAFGAETAALENGGYPDGYIKTAVNSGLLNGIVSDKGVQMSRWQIAVMIYNCFR